MSDQIKELREAYQQARFGVYDAVLDAAAASDDAAAYYAFDDAYNTAVNAYAAARERLDAAFDAFYAAKAALEAAEKEMTNE